MQLSLKKITAILLTALTVAPSFVYATDFNPNFILSDAELQNSQSMSTVDIQAFLENHGGYISTLKIADFEGKERPVSYIISQAAQAHQINPKYLLVKLQKEQGLITEKNPTQKQLDGATGYGITDGCGWSCDSFLNNQGFGKQVDSAAAIMRWYFDNLTANPWIKRPPNTYTIDNTTVKPVNLATAFLYTYTPHIQGNQNFWTLWQKWFEQVYPDGTLVKTTSDKTVYVIQDGKKRPFASMTALNSRFDPKMIVTAPEAELNRYELGTPIKLPNYAILKQNAQYYLVDYQTIRPFASEAVVRKLGYNPDEVIDVTSDDLAGFTIGSPIVTENASPLGRLVRVKENNSLYYLNEGKYHAIYDEKIAKIRFPNLTIEKVTAAALADYPDAGAPILFKDGTLFGITGSNKIYVVENGKKRHIASEAVYNGLGYNWNNIIWTNEFAGMAHETGEPVYLREDIAVPPPQSAPAQNNTPVAVKPETPTGTGTMVRTSSDAMSFTGPQFATPIDTYLVADFNTQQILAGKNIDTVRPLASFTKVMTGYRLLKEGLSLTKSITYDATVHKATYDNYRLVTGERVLTNDLMNALLVSSLNTPARMLVATVAPNSEDAFIGRMNSQATEWGLAKTHFSDAYGYDLKNETTAREFLALFSKAIDNIDLREFLGRKRYEYDELKDIDGKPHHFDEHSNALANKIGLPFTIIASKTGYLDESGANLVMLVERPSDGKKFVVMTMGNPDYTHRFDEPEKLARWTMNNL